MHWSHLSKEQWEILFYSSLNNDYLSKTAKLVGISIVSAFYNRHKLMYVLNELINKKQLSKKIALDETYLTYQAKGFVNQNRRGISKDKIGIACAIDEDGNYVVHTADRGRPTSSTLIDIFKNTIRPGSIVISDSQRSYHQLMDALNIKWVKITAGSNSSSSKPAEHTHNWVAVTETRTVVDQPAYDEQVPVTEMREHEICSSCGADLTGTDASAHVYQHMINGDDKGGWHSEWREEVTGYQTVHHDAVTHTETVTTGYRCSTCGASK